MLDYGKFSWVFKQTAKPKHGNPWQVEGGKWRAHSIAGDTSSPIVDVPAPTAGQAGATGTGPKARLIPESLSDKRTLRASINAALTSGRRGMSKDEIQEMLMHRMELDRAIAAHKREKAG